MQSCVWGQDGSRQGKEWYRLLLARINKALGMVWEGPSVGRNRSRFFWSPHSIQMSDWHPDWLEKANLIGLIDDLGTLTFHALLKAQIHEWLHLQVLALPLYFEYTNHFRPNSDMGNIRFTIPGRLTFSYLTTPGTVTTMEVSQEFSTLPWLQEEKYRLISVIAQWAIALR